jgi:flagellar motor switch/type III secretory pathway protein FliN
MLLLLPGWMATAQPVPAQATGPRPMSDPRQAGELRQAKAPETATGQPESAQALVPAPRPPEPAQKSIFSGPVTRLPVELEVAVPVRNFRVRNLLALAPGALVESQWGHGNDIPLAADQVRLCWSEFEVVDTKLAVRVTRLD